MYFGYFGSHERIFPLEKTNIHRLIKEKEGGGGEGDASLIFGASLARRKQKVIICFVFCPFYVRCNQNY